MYTFIENKKDKYYICVMEFNILTFSKHIHTSSYHAIVSSPKTSIDTYIMVLQSKSYRCVILYTGWVNISVQAGRKMYA